MMHGPGNARKTSLVAHIGPSRRLHRFAGRVARVGQRSYIAAIMLRRIAALSALLLFGTAEPGLAQSRAQRGYPSLAPRSIETRDRDAEIAKAALDQPMPKPLAPALTAELARLGTQASTAGQAFDQDYAASTRLVAAADGTAPASEAWVAAQEAISALDARRFDSVTALASIDSIYVDQLNVGGDASTVEGYRTPVAVMVDGQNDRLDSLRFRLAQP